MRTVTFVKHKTVDIVEKPIPEIGPDEVLVKISGAGLCHSDLHLIEMPDDSPLDEAVQAFHDLEAGKVKGRIVLVP